VSAQQIRWQQKTANVLERWDYDGLPEERAA
jgi:hypothetical protein